MNAFPMFSRWLILSILFCSTLSSVQGQDRSQYQLLWRIQHDSLEQTSYLFGTMHLKDARVFDFSDSVLAAFDKCEVFAPEINLNAYLKQMVNKKLTSDTVNYLKEELSSEAYDLLDEKLKRELDIDLDQLKVKSPSIIRRLLNEDKDHDSEDRKAVLDAYLSYLATAQGKTIVGLERFDDPERTIGGFKDELDKAAFIDELLSDSSSDKATLLDDIVLSTRYSQEEFIKTYYEGNLSKLDSIVALSQWLNPGSAEQLKKRNRTMAHVADSTIQLHSTFIAVGAAHLQGEEGLIELLRGRGYRVSPVKATFTGLAKVYEERFNQQSSHRLEKLSEGYGVTFNTKPIRTQVPNTNVDMYLLNDAKNGAFYMAMVFDVIDMHQEQEELFDLMIEQMTTRQGLEVSSRASIVYQDREGVEVKLSGAGISYGIMRVFIYNNRGYLFMVTSDTKISSKQKGAFLNSVDFYDISFKETHWQEVTDTLGSFKAQIFSSYNQISRSYIMDEEGAVLKLNVLSALGFDNKASLILQYYDLPTGYFYENDSIIIKELVTSLEQEYKSQVVASREIKINEYTGRAYDFKSDLGKQQARIIIRGNRAYVLFSQVRDTSLIQKADRFLTDFTFLPLPSMVLQTYQTPSFSIHLPKEVKIETQEYYYNEVDSSITYSASDTKTSTVFIIQEDWYNPFTYYPNLDTIIASYKRNNPLATHVALIDSGKSVYQGIPYYYRTLRDPNTNYIKKERLYVLGQKILYLDILLPLELKNSKQVDQIYESIQFHKETFSNTHLTIDKSSALFAALQSEDATRQESAKKAISTYPFKVGHLPEIYRLLSHQFDDDTLDYGPTRMELMDILKQVQDSNTVSVLTTIYDSDPVFPLKNKTLKTLQGVGSPEALQAFFYRAKTFKVPEGKYTYGIFSNFYFYDSLNTILGYLDRLMPLMQNPDLQNDLANLLNYYQYRDTSFKQHLVPYKEEISTAFLNLMRPDILQVNEDSINYTETNVLTSLGSLLLMVDPSEKYLSYFQTLAKNPYIRFQITGFAGLMVLGERVNKKDLLRLFTNKEWGYIFYEELESLNLLPVLQGVVNQRQVAEMFVRRYIDYEEYPPEELDWYKDILVNTAEGEKRIITFLVRMDYEEEHYVYYVGYQPKDTKKVKMTEGTTGVYYQQTFSEENWLEIEQTIIQTTKEALLEKSQQ